MKKILFYLVLVAISYLFATEMFNPDMHLPNELLVSFNAKAIGSNTGSLNIISNAYGQIQIGLENFDRIAVQYNFIKLEQVFPEVKNKDWQAEDGTYLMNIFRIHLKNNDVINEALDELAKDPAIIYAEFDFLRWQYGVQEYIPNDPNYTNAWFLSKIDAPKLWYYFQGSDDIVVAIVDSGAKWNHEDMREQIWINENNADQFTIDWGNGTISPVSYTQASNVMGWDFWPQTTRPNNPFQSYPGNTHGTHVAGTVGAEGDNNKGALGVGFKIKLMITKHQSHLQESPNITNGYNGIIFAADNGASVINCSWGGTGFSNSEQNTITYATDAGSIVVAAAGNDDLNMDFSNHYPSNYNGVLCVAATTSADVKSDFSNYGSRVDVCAPGSGIYATLYNSIGNDTYGSLNGTSMASPIAASVVAITKYFHPDLSPYEIIERVKYTADPINEGTYSGLLGTGRVNVYRSALMGIIPNIEMTNIQLTVNDGTGDNIPRKGDLVKLKVTFSNEIDWANATGITAKITTEAEGVEIIEPNLNINNIINGWNQTSTNEASLRILNTFNDLEIPLTIEFNSNQEASNLYRYATSFSYSILVSVSKPNWPLDLGNTPTAPKVANLDGTGRRFVTISNGILHVVDMNNIPINNNFPLDLGTPSQAGVAIGNITSNSSLDIVTVSSSGVVKVISPQGLVVLSKELGFNVISTPSIADLNNDGKNEIIIATQNGNIFVLNSLDLSIWNGYPVKPAGNILTQMAIGDVNNDGLQEIVLNTTGSDAGLHAINPITGLNISGFPVSTGIAIVGPSLINISGQTGLCIISSSNNSSNCPVYVVASNGNILYQTTVANRVTTEFSLTDLFLDGNMKIVFGTSTGGLYVMNPDLSVVPGFPVQVGSPIYSSPVFARLNYANGRSIFFGDNSGQLNIVDNTGNFTKVLKISNSGLTTSPYINPIENNNGLLFIANNSEILCIDLGIATTALFWNQFRGNLGNTACVTDPTTPTLDDETPSLVNALQQNYPNPFNPSTTIHYTLKNSEFVKLSIYNIKGQIINNLINENKPAGNHAIVWNGIDNNNIPVSSGVYFYRIETNSFSDIKRMILLK